MTEAADRLDDHVGTYAGPSNIGDLVFAREGDALVMTLPLLDSANVPYEPGQLQKSWRKKQIMLLG